MVEKEFVSELRQIIKEDYGKDFSFQEVSRFAYDWLGYFDLLAKVSHRTQKDIQNG